MSEVEAVFVEELGRIRKRLRISAVFMGIALVGECIASYQPKPANGLLVAVGIVCFVMFLMSSLAFFYYTDLRRDCMDELRLARYVNRMAEHSLRR